MKKTALKLFISALLLYLVFKNIDTSKLISILLNSNPWWILVAFLFYNLSKIVSSVRLNFYFKDLNIYLTQSQALKLYYLGMFYNLFLPGGIGGDGYKIYLLQKRFKVGYKPLFLAILLDRLSGLIALLFLCGVLFFFSPYAYLYPLLRDIDLLLLPLLYPSYILLQKQFFPKFSPSLVPTTLLGLLVQLLQLVSAFALIEALEVEIITFLTLFLISSVVAVIPISVGGVGMREFTFLQGLKIVGKEPSAGVAFSFLFFLITLLSSAIGAIFLFESKES